MGKRLGNQTPTTSVFLATDEDVKRGDWEEAIELYNKTGKKAMEWQEKLMQQILARNEDELWVHTKFCYSVPRRNGKSEILLARTLYGLMHGEKILYTAHRTTTSHSFFERVDAELANLGYVKASEARKEDEVPDEELYDSYKANGLESIKLRLTGGKISFRTRTSKGGLGEEFSTILWDEGQEIQDEQLNTLQYTVSSTPNPQMIFCGTPPTAVSSGTVFQNMRTKVLETGMKNTGWAEWSVEEKTDPEDVESWYKCNPSLGTVFTERAIEDEIGADDLDFNIQRLGFWVTYNLASAIPKNVWERLETSITPEQLVGKLFIGIKFGKDGKNVAMSLACRTTEDKIFVSALRCKPVLEGIDWITELLSHLDYAEVVADGKNGQKMLEDQMKAKKLKYLSFPTVAEVINANAVFEQGLYNNNICHTRQEIFDSAVTNCKKRTIGSNGGFGYESLTENQEIALLDSAIYAYWACNKAKTRKPQKVTY